MPQTASFTATSPVLPQTMEIKALRGRITGCRGAQSQELWQSAVSRCPNLAHGPLRG
jgi:hypothetical protein